MTDNTRDISLQQTLDFARQLHKSKKLDQAKRIYKELLNKIPNEAIVLHLLGLIYFEQNTLLKAEKLFLKAIELKPDFDEAHNNLANLFMHDGRLKEAIVSFNSALKLNPNNATTHYNLAIVYENTKASDKAILHYKNAIELKPDFVEAHINLASLCNNLGDLEESAVYYSKALELVPNISQVERNFGTVLKGLGKIDDAINHFNIALKITPDDGDAFRQKAFIRDHKSYSDDLKNYENIYNNDLLNDDNKMHFAFGFGKVFEDLKEFDKSFDYYKKGNNIKRKNTNFDINKWTDYISQQISVFDKHLFESNTNIGHDDNTPIFILGMLRSGTSLVEQILNSHHQVSGAGEVSTLNHVISQAYDMKKYPNNLDASNIELLNSLGKKYCELMKAKGKEENFVTDKMTGNFIHIGIIKLILPQAKIIHCERNPLDNCWSVYKNYFSNNGHQYAYDLSDLALYYKQYQRLSEHWNKLFPDSIHSVQYEDLVNGQKTQTKKLLEHCNLQWDENCMTYYQLENKVQTASDSQVRKPIYKQSIGSWKNYENRLALLTKVLN